MQPANKYDKQDIIDTYKEKCIEAQKILKYRDLNKYDDLPSQGTITNRFGGIKNLRKKANVISEAKQKPENIKFCNDCLYNRFECDKKVEECKEEADDYFDFVRKMELEGVW
ncbi:MAG: hypothetical protein ACQEQF_01845 [Bacillota bacterium]